MNQFFIENMYKKESSIQITDLFYLIFQMDQAHLQYALVNGDQSTRLFFYKDIYNAMGCYIYFTFVITYYLLY